MAIDGDAGYGFRQTGTENGGPCHVKGLRPDLAHAAKNHVVHLLRRHTDTAYHRINHPATHIRRVYLAQPTILLATSGTHRRYDICLCHLASPHTWLTKTRYFL